MKLLSFPLRNPGKEEVDTLVCEKVERGEGPLEPSAGVGIS